MNVDHVNVKIFASPETTRIDWQQLIPVFHRWIQQDAVPELAIDVADYSHVPGGPGVMLIAHEAFYSVDNREDRPGLLYNRRTALEGSFPEKLAQAYEAALGAAHRLQREPEFTGKLRFDERTCEISVNDRMLAPNTAATWEALGPDIEAFFATRFGSAPRLHWDCADARRLFRVSVNSGDSV